MKIPKSFQMRREKQKAGKWDDGGGSSSFVASLLGQDSGDECIALSIMGSAGLRYSLVELYFTFECNDKSLHSEKRFWVKLSG